MSVAKNNPAVVPRYGIVQKDYVFDKDLLHRYMDTLSEEYQLTRFDEELYNQAMAEDWSREFCETFISAGDYLSRGFGYGIIYQGKLVSGTSTMTVYDGGTEVQLATHPEFRQKGLAMACAATFLLECQQQGIRACWDAANLTSKKIALALGYEYKGEYMTIHMRID